MFEEELNYPLNLENPFTDIHLEWHNLLTRQQPFIYSQCRLIPKIGFTMEQILNQDCFQNRQKLPQMPVTVGF